MLEIAVEFSSFLIFLFVGLISPRLLLYAYIWVAPFLGGNLIAGFYVPYPPGRSIAFALVASTMLRGRFWNRLGKYGTSLVSVLLCIVALTAVGGLFAWSNREELLLSVWNQPPLTKALRALLAEAVFWLAPACAIGVLTTPESSRFALRQVAHSAVFYVSLGLLQFLIANFFGYDLFPVVRVAAFGQVVGVQNVGLTRITSICGEPRYFGVFCALWFALVLVAGGHLGFPRSRRAAVAGMFLLGAVLTGSRSALVLIAVVLVASLLGAGATGASHLALRRLPLLSGAIVLFAFALTSDRFVLSSRLVVSDRAEGDYIELAGVRIPMEYQDKAAVSALQAKPFAHLIGFGPGLWQYYANPFENSSLRATYFSNGVASLDSMRQNSAILSRYVSFGLVGLAFMAAACRRLYELIRVHARSAGARRRLKAAFFVFMTLTCATNFADVYYLLTLILACSVVCYPEQAQTSASRAQREMSRQTPRHDFRVPRPIPPLTLPSDARV